MSIAALGYEIDSSQAVRAERDLDRMAAAADRAGDGAEGLERQSSGLAATLRALAPVAGAIAGSLAAMFSARAVIGAAETYETRMARINAIIRATGGVAGRTAEQLEAQAQSLARATLESVDGVMNAQQVLLTFRNVQGEVFDRAIEGAADLAAAMGTDIVGATRQLARALEDPINGVTALTRSGTVFTQQQRDQIRALVESGRTLEAQNIILAELEGQYGGAARAAGGLTAAKDSLGQSINNLLISINNSIGLTDALAVVYNRTADGVQYLADNIGILWNIA
jgi:phage-related minor tail protein